MPRRKPRIHLTTLGSSATRDVNRLGGFQNMLDLAKEGVTGRYQVTANRRMILAAHDQHGARADDAARAAELQQLLRDESVAAVVTVRGGAWFTRILDRIDFDVLTRRRNRLWLFGFSEMTTLVNIAGQYASTLGVYDMGPGFLYAGLKRYAEQHLDALTRDLDLPAQHREGFAAGWAAARYPQEFQHFFREVADILDGTGSSRVPSGRLLAGPLPKTQPITITGGTLSVILPLIGARYASAIDTTGKWLAIEDINEDLDPIDRMLAALKLAGLLERAEGFIIGNFHTAERDLSEAAFHVLQRNLPRNSKQKQPVIALDNLGHVYPMAPLPMHRRLTLRRVGPARPGARVAIDIPWSDWTR